MTKRKASSELRRETDLTKVIEEEPLTDNDEELRPSDKSRFADEVTTIDSDGDLQMDFFDAGKIRGLLVNKHTLCMASEVFRKILAKDSPFQENQGVSFNHEGVHVIRFEEDEVAPMQIIMDAIHLNGNKVPTFVSFRLLEQIAITCDKYDLRRSLGAWPRLWMEQYRKITAADGFGRLLFIATVFEYVDLYPHITKHLIMTSMINRDGEIRDGNGIDFDYGVPETTIGKVHTRQLHAKLSQTEKIIQRRETVVTGLFGCCLDVLSSLRNRRYCQISIFRRTAYSESEEQAMDCEMFHLGCLSQQFPGLGGNGTDFKNMSIANIMKAINSIRKTTGKRKHHSCSVAERLRNEAEPWISKVEGFPLKF